MSEEHGGRHDRGGPPGPKNAPVGTIQARRVGNIRAAEAIAGFKARVLTEGKLIYVGVFEIPGDPQIVLVYQVGPEVKAKHDVKYLITTKRDAPEVNALRS